jgi:hypothetical protein
MAIPLPCPASGTPDTVTHAADQGLVAPTIDEPLPSRRRTGSPSLALRSNGAPVRLDVTDSLAMCGLRGRS